MCAFLGTEGKNTFQVVSISEIKPKRKQKSKPETLDYFKNNISSTKVSKRYFIQLIL